MNGNDLLDALSGIDPKYIDEAACELHGSPAQVKKAKIASIKRFAAIALPAAAAVLLTVTVALPMITRLGSTSSAPAASESAAPAAYDEAAMDEATEDIGDAAGYGATEAPSYDKDAGEDSAAINEAAATEATASESEADATALLGLTDAVYEDGILTIEMSGSLPDYPEDLEYRISSADGEAGAAGTTGDGSGTTLAEGIVLAEGRVGEILWGTDPLALDLTELDLPAGSYILTLGDESIEFTCR